MRTPENLFDRFEALATGENRAFVVTPAGRTITYAEANATSARLANTLVALGVAIGDRVAVQVEKSPEAILLYLACLRAGAVFLPLNTAYTPNEIDYFLRDAEPKLFVAAPGAKAALEAVARAARVAAIETLGTAGDGSLMERAATQPTAFATAMLDRHDLAAILYTSGTTGRSKGAMLSHENLASNAHVLSYFWRFTAEDVLLHALPIYHTHGLFVATNVILQVGASMLFLPKFDSDQVFALLPRATTMMGVPTFYVRLLDDPRLTREATAHMRLFVSGSAPLLADTHRGFEERTGHAILERYGMTETNMNTSNPYAGDRIAGTVGPSLPGITVRVVNPETGRQLPMGEIGMIEVKGPNVFKGYWRNPEKTKAEFRDDGFFVTGDLGKVDWKGYVTIVGRGKDLVITGGFNVYPKEVESEIDALPGVVESAVIGVPHKDFGEGVTAIVVRATGVTLDEAGILAALQPRLAKFKQPKRVIFVDDLPRNAMGKVQKNVLRVLFERIYD